MVQPTPQWSSEQVTPNDGGLLPAPELPDTLSLSVAWAPLHTLFATSFVLWPIPSNAIRQQLKTEGRWRFRCRPTDMPFGSRGGGMLPGLEDEQIRWAADLRALDRSRIRCDTLASNAS